MSKSDAPKSMTSTGSSQPWAEQAPYLQQGFGRALNLYNKGPTQYYPGQTVAGQSPYTQQAIGRMAGSANDPNSLTNQSLGEFGKTISGQYLNPDSNPYLKASVDDALGQVQGRVSGLYGSRGGNNYGSSAHEETLGRTLAATALPMYAQNYQQERGRQLNAAQLGPGIEAQGAAGLTQAGAATDAFQQAQINADKARFDFGQTSPWDTLQRYQSAISGNYGGLQTQTSPYFGPNQAANIAGGAATGLGIYNQGKQTGLWGTNAGGGGGLIGNTNYDSGGQFNPYYSGMDASGGYAYG
jgi:hypothetical protein